MVLLIIDIIKGQGQVDSMRQVAQDITLDDALASAAEQRDAVAEFIATHAAELSLLARRHKLDTLGYLLDMARLEAESTAQAGGRRN
jgi:hypothetical protein